MDEWGAFELNLFRSDCMAELTFTFKFFGSVIYALPLGWRIGIGSIIIVNAHVYETIGVYS